MKSLSLSVVALVAIPLTGFGFLPNPDLLTISPAVVKAGSTVEVTISGTHLEEARELRFTHPGITATPVLLPADEFHPEARPVEGRFTITIGAGVEPGIYEVRSLGYFGLSTARPIKVLGKEVRLLAEEGEHSTRETAALLEIETGITGALDSGRFDWYRFSAGQGERILLNLWAERIDSRADVLMALYDGEGRELESSRHHFGRDPFIDFTAPEDGEYFVSLTDALYLGNGQYFYYLDISTGPQVDFVFPPAGIPGEERRFTLFGRNLPGGSLGENHALDGRPLETVEVEIVVPAEVKTPPGFHPGIPRQGILPAFEHRFEGADPVRIGFATAPILAEEATVEEQSVSLPVEIAGRFDEPGDVDVFRFSVSQGITYWIDVVSHRLGSVADPLIVVEKIGKDAEGNEFFKKVVENDDLPSFYGRDSLDDLNVDSLDPATSFTADEDGEYRLSIINQSAGGSLAHLYRLAVREAQPDFQLLVGTELTKTINNDAYPIAPLIRRNGSMIYRVMALRRDGFEGDITVTARGLPEGVSADPLVLAGDSRQGFLTLWASAETAAWAGPIEIVGTAPVGNQTVSRSARPASLLWGRRVFGNASQVRSRLDSETVLSVIETESNPTRLKPSEDKVWTVEMNESLEIPFEVIDSGPRVGNLQVNVHGFPGLHRSPPNTVVGEGATEGKLVIPFKPSANFAVEAGTYQFVLQGIGNASYQQNPAAADRASAEVERLEKLAQGVAAEIETAKARLTRSERELAEAGKQEGAAADDAARAALKGESESLKAQVAEAKEAVAQAEARHKQVEKLKGGAAKVAKAAADQAKEKTSQFATYSLPITVEVKPVPEKK